VGVVGMVVVVVREGSEVVANDVDDDDDVGVGRRPGTVPLARDEKRTKEWTPTAIGVM
jgi:hypothetical protein